MGRAAVGRTLVTAAVLLTIWEALVRLLSIPAYILPGPFRVAATLAGNAGFLAENALVTLTEILAGLTVGVAVGLATALAMARSRLVHRWLSPLMVVAQALPVFAIAPLLVVWFGFGLASKVVMAALIIFFPVAAAFHDGLRRTDPGLVDLATLYGARPAQMLALIRIPAALPSLATGLRAAAAVAPIGAVVGEWVGASAGLGFVMTQANARMQTDLMFAALVLLVAMALILWTLTDMTLRRALHWVPETLNADDRLR
jgi:putative hydroxymethylpyrimidine transport system permease protein